MGKLNQTKIRATTKLYLLLAFLLWLSLYSSAQDAGNINKAKQALIQAASDTARANALSWLCNAYSTINTDTAIIYGEEALALATKINFTKGIGDAYANTGWSYFHKGDYKKAEEHLNKAVIIFENTKNNKSLLSPLSDLGSIYFEKSDYVKSLSYFLRVLKIAQQTGMKTNEGLALYNIGKVYNHQKNFPEAGKYFQQSYNIQKSLGNDIYIAESLMSLGNTAQSMNDYSGSLKYYTEAFPYFKKEGDVYRQGLINENIGVLYFNHNEFEKAMQHFLSAKKFYTRLDSKTDIAYALTEIAETDSALNNLQKSLDTYNQSLQLAKEVGSKDIEQYVLLGLSNIYLKKEDYKNAYQYKEAANAIKDSLFTLERSSALMKLQTQFETDKKEKENQLLKTQNDLAKANLKKNRAWLLASGIVLVLLTILLAVIYRNRKIKIRNIELLKKQSTEILRMNNILELRALQGQMDTHFIFNCMASLQALIWTNRNDEANDYLSKFSRLLRMVLENSELPAVSLDEELDMLKRYLDLESIRLKETFSYKIIVEENLFTEAIYIPTLIMQPFVENAIWHGLMAKEEGRLLTVTVKANNKLLTCVVEDNGIGRVRSKQQKITASHNSKGVQAIEDRLKLVREQSLVEETGLEIIDLYNTENEACGTRVIIRMPVKQSFFAENKMALFSDIKETVNDMIKALLIDDEENTITVMKGIIEKFIPEITAVYTAIGGKQGLQAVYNYNPDLIFLDIEMPVMNGFDLLQKLSGHLFEVIFVTAYNHYAIKAVRFSALDYLLKPVDKDELKFAVKRFIEKRRSQNDLQHQYENFLQNLKSKNNNRLAISTTEGIHFIMPSNIIRCEAEGSYTKFYLTDKKTVTTSRVLKEYDQILSDHDFIRVHRTHLINRSYINSISGDHQLTLTDNTLIEVSRRKWDEVKKMLVN